VLLPNKNVLSLSRILAKKGIDLDEGYSHLHPSHPKPKKSQKKTKKKEKRKKKKRIDL